MQKYYRRGDEVLAFDADQLHLVTGDMILMTDNEYIDYINPPHLKWERYQAEARVLLEFTDLIALRCWKAGIQYPIEWQLYTEQLREILRTETGDHTQPLPIAPIKPEGV